MMEDFRVMDDASVLRLCNGLLRVMRQGFRASLQTVNSPLSQCYPYSPPQSTNDLSSLPNNASNNDASGTTPDGIGDGESANAKKHDDGEGEKDRGGRGGSLPMILLPLPEERKQIGPQGRLVIDLGGSNFRCALVDTNMEALKWQSWPVECKDARVFSWCASRIAEFLKSFLRQNGDKDGDSHDKELAFAFSFPIRQRHITEAILLQWNKDYNAPGLIGQDVVQLLTQELARLDLHVRVTCVVNDAVATMLAAQYMHGPRALGVIIGTGTNASCHLRPSREAGYPLGGGVAVNLEWGRFGMVKEERLLLPIRPFDEDVLALDQGHQILEKLTSGLFLPMLYNDIAAKHPDEFPSNAAGHRPRLHIEGAKQLSEAEARGDGMARFLSQRSVEIMAAAIIALRDFFLEPDDSDAGGDTSEDVVVAIDGTMFERYHSYQDRLRLLIDHLNRGRRATGKIVLTSGKDFSCFGAIVF